MGRSNLEPGKPGPGRPPGSRNKHTVIAKDAIALAAEKLGGVDRLVTWANSAPENERVFWGTIYPKLLPLQVAGDPDAPLHVTGTLRRIVDAAAN